LQIAKPISIGDDDSLTTPSAGLYGKSQRRPQGQTVLTFKLVAAANEVLHQLNRTEERKKDA